VTEPAVASEKKKRINRSRNSRRANPLKQAAKSSAKSNFKPKAVRASAIPITARDKRAGKWFEKLVALQARLRGPGGCPWDHEQSHQSLRKFLIEETYEVLDAMESSDAKHFASELGDLLLQVIFHSILAEETGAFTISDVIESVHTKMVRRHPHVFGNIKARNSKEVLENWEQIKSEERAAQRAQMYGQKKDRKLAVTVRQSDELPGQDSGVTSILSDVPKSLPAALEAYQLTRRAARVGFDWDELAGIFEKIDEEKAEIMQSLGQLSAKSSPAENAPKQATASGASDLASLEEEVGDLLFAAVNVARFVGTDPEIALKHANRKFLRRFQWMETAARAEGKKFADLPRERMEALWNLSKQRKNSKMAAAK
jgi:tetrapyrrole methylase family protein / MazG family protein